MVAVDEIDVGVAGRPEEYRVAQGLTRGSVRGGIVYSEVGFYLDDAAGESLTIAVANQDFSQKLSRYALRIAHEKVTIKRTNRRRGTLYPRGNHGKILNAKNYPCESDANLCL